MEEGQTQAVNTLFNQIETKTIGAVTVEPTNPTAGEDSNYKVIFTADVSIPTDSYVVVTLP